MGIVGEVLEKKKEEKLRRREQKDEVGFHASLLALF